MLNLDGPSEEVIAADKKRMVVDAFARWRITDPLLFYQSLTNQQIATIRLTPILSSNVRRVLGSQNFAAVLSGKRAALMTDIRNNMNQDAASFGIKVVDVRIRRADLPRAEREAIYQRMQKEREREAAEYRAEGQETAQRIKARADREVTVLTAEATRESRNPARRGRCREDPHPRPGLRPGSGILRLLPFDAGLYRMPSRATTPPWCCRPTASSSSISATAERARNRHPCGRGARTPSVGFGQAWGGAVSRGTLPPGG